MSKPRIAIIGLGGYFRALAPILFEQCEVVALLDNDREKQGTMCLGITVMSPEQGPYSDIDMVLLTSLFGNKMQAQLQGLGVPAEKIKRLNQLTELVRLPDDFIAPQQLPASPVTSKRKVLLVAESMMIGGVEYALINLLRQLDPNRFDLTLLVLFPGGPLVDEVPKHVRVHFAFNEATPVANRLIALVNLPPKQLYELFIGDTFEIEVAFKEGFCMRLLAGSNQPNKLSWIHTDYQHDPWTTELFRPGEERHLNRDFSRFISVSNNALQAWQSTLDPQKKHPVQVLHNLIDSLSIYQKAKAAPTLPAPEGMPRIVSVGRLHPTKGFDRLIAVHKQLLDENKLHQLVIIGDGEARGQLETLISQWQLQHTVVLTGELANPHPLVASADIYVSPSRAESYGLSLLEAMLLKKPIVATDTAGSREILDNGRYGQLVHDEQAMVVAITKLLEDESARIDAAQRAFDGVSALMSANNIQACESLLLGNWHEN